MKAFLDFLNKNLEAYLCCIMMFALSIILIVQVFFRYCLGQSLTWSEELARYLFVWLVYLGIPYGCQMMRHIKIDAGLMLFPKTCRKYVILIGEISFLVLAIVVTYYSWMFVIKQYKFGLVSPAMGIPLWVIYSAPLVGFVLASLRQIQVIIYRLKHFDVQGEDDGQGVV